MGILGIGDVRGTGDMLGIGDIDGICGLFIGIFGSAIICFMSASMDFPNRVRRAGRRGVCHGFLLRR